MGRPPVIVMEIGHRLTGKYLPRSAMLAIVSFTMLAVIAVANPFLEAAQEMSCCSLAAGSCRNDCSKISLVALGAEAEARENATQRLLELCSLELTEFWGCVNSTLNEVKRHENWTGRRCCYLVQNPICRSTCALSGSRRNLNESCRPSDEPEFFSCLERREEAEHCCGKVSNDTCRAVCQNLFYKREKISSRNGCFHQMPKCLKSVTEVKHAENPKQHLHCCNKADSLTCMETCKKILYTATTDRQILNALTEKCGPPISPQSPFWSCLMKSGSPKPVRLPLDAGKLSCCTKAIKPKCQDLCWRAFKADWESSWHPLDAECLSSSQEGELRRCLEDTDDPCEMGCAGLSYCTRFNDRSTTLFRSCSATTDEAAKFEAHHWSRGGIIRGLSLPIRVAATCPPETLRAAACLLQLRPCETKSHETRLCREDCLELMASCVDWSAITGPHTAATLCAKLSPAKSDAPCVSLKPFLEDPQDNESVVRLEEDITTPCKINPCAQGEICQLLHHGRQAYRCVPACFLGKMSKQLVPVGSWAQIPSFNQASHQICQCTPYGLDKCKMLNYVKFNPCSIHNQIIAHKANFYVECNPCHCFEGEYTCSKKNCGEIPSLPCDCPPHYVPVCGKLGFTFASGCLATCARMSVNDVEFGSCSSRDPCASNPCDTTERCVARGRVCLSELHKPCRQYECVPLDCDPRDEAGGPVCDKENRQHRSVCAMIRAGAALGYRGHCLEGCTLRGPVCGANGEVYANECAAWAERTVVDYFGPCAAVGLIGDQAKPRCGDLVQCPRLIEPYCVGVTPPGACCPVCGGAAKLFYSKKQLDRIYYVMKEDVDKDTVTLEALLSALARQIQVAQCVLRGMMTPDRDIFIVVQPTSRRPSTLQLRACVTETEKLVTRILERSPKITVEVPLSALIRAEIAHSYISSAITIGGYVTMQIFLAIFLYVIF